MSDYLNKVKARIGALFRAPVNLGRDLERWPRHLVEGDYYVVNGTTYKITEGVWRPR